jgi:hypothetical protein
MVAVHPTEHGVDAIGGIVVHRYTLLSGLLVIIISAEVLREDLIVSP